jgi:adenosylhomocysteine nucleosidase
MPNIGALPMILAPTTFEYRVVHKALRGWLAEGRGLCWQCGMGEARAEAFCRTLESQPPGALVLLGWGGGLDPELAAGAVICGDAALRAGQPALAGQVLLLPGCRVGPTLTVPRALCSPAEKRQAQAGGALAVEMEAYPLARWALRRGIPFFHVRLISDALDETLPDLGAGEAGLGGVLKHILRRPALLPELWRFGQRVRALNPRLAELAREIAAELT